MLRERSTLINNLHRFLDICLTVAAFVSAYFIKLRGGLGLCRRWARKTGLNDLLLETAVLEIQRGLLEADLGGGIVKKRIAFPGRGRGGEGSLVEKYEGQHPRIYFPS